MYKIFLAISVRNLLRNKIFTAVNIFGLAVGMAACFAILQYVHFEMSYDKFHKNADRIYRVILQTDNHYRAANHPAAGPALKQEFSEVVEYARAVHQSIWAGDHFAWSYTDKQGNKKVFNLDNAYFVDPSFVTMFSFPFIYGDPTSVLKNPNDVAISRSVSQKFQAKMQDFVLLILIAGIVALPCVYFLGKYWLNNFAFKINIGWMIFILPLLILLIITLVTTGVQTIKSSLINPADTLKDE